MFFLHKHINLHKSIFLYLCFLSLYKLSLYSALLSFARLLNTHFTPLFLSLSVQWLFPLSNFVFKKNLVCINYQLLFFCFLYAHIFVVRFHESWSFRVSSPLHNSFQILFLKTLQVSFKLSYISFCGKFFFALHINCDATNFVLSSSSSLNFIKFVQNNCVCVHNHKRSLLEPKF